ncbi:MAG: hypothetical protein CR997_05910 [Acidobacteria bacterium]|nr:MAG: hypothetical protein CR997_05910 [Acidobacteriota bacterium]
MKKRKSPLFVGFEGLEPDWLSLKEINPLGVVLFQRNLDALEQIQDVCRKIHDTCPGSVIAIDQEGGRVNRLSHLLPPFPAPPTWKNAKDCYDAGYTMGRALRALDIDMNFAPAVDLDYGEDDNALQGRLLGNRPEKVVEFSDAYLRGLTAAGCMGCIKHFPGLGTTKVDSHLFLPKYRGTYKTWQQEEAAVYKGLLAGKWSAVPVMMAHCIIPFWENQIASSSALAVENLRAMGSTGLIMTDDLEMKAVPEDELEPFCRRSLKAGVDILMVCQSKTKAERMFEWSKDHPSRAQEKLKAHRAQCQDIKPIGLAELEPLWTSFQV